MFKFATLAFLGVASCFNQEESVSLKAKGKGAGVKLNATV